MSFPSHAAATQSGWPVPQEATWTTQMTSTQSQRDPTASATSQMRKREPRKLDNIKCAQCRHDKVKVRALNIKNTHMYPVLQSLAYNLVSAVHSLAYGHKSASGVRAKVSHAQKERSNDEREEGCRPLRPDLRVRKLHTSTTKSLTFDEGQAK